MKSQDKKQNWLNLSFNEEKSQASESKGRKEEKIEGVKNSPQTLTLKEKVNTEKNGGKKENDMLE